eukprot:jgi/Chlat1/2834/Chrsp187S02974
MAVMAAPSSLAWLLLAVALLLATTAEAKLGGKIAARQHLINAAAGKVVHGLGYSGAGYMVIDALAHEGEAAALAAALKAVVGAKDVHIAGDYVSARVPAKLATLDHLDNLPELIFATPSLVRHHTGSKTTQGDIAERSNVLRSNHPGIIGSGIKVGVIGDSYNAKGGASANVASGDLPSNVNVVADDASGQDEGRAMLQIVYDVAPGATLYFHTASGGVAPMANAITTLANLGCQVIIDDTLYYLAEPFYQEGIVAQAVDNVNANQNVAYFSAAGNEGSCAWRTNTWTESAKGQQYVFDSTAPNNFQSFTVAARDTLTIVLQWSDPWNNAVTNLDASLYTKNSDGTYTQQDSDTFDNRGAAPIASVSYTNPNSAVTSVYFTFRRAAGPAPSHVNYVCFSQLTSSSTAPSQYQVYAPSLFGHANAPGAFAVAAVQYDKTPSYTGQSVPGPVEDYSSTGGMVTYFGWSGNAITPKTQSKPDATAPDRVVTTVNGFTTFGGTSAAAPHVGGVAALLRQRSPTRTPAEIYNALRSTAIDMDDPYRSGFNTGFDYATGTGLIDAEAAYVAVT